LALYQGSGATSRRWLHIRGWRHIMEVAVHQGGGAVSRKWRYINEVAPYQGIALHQRGGAISRKQRCIKEVVLYPGVGILSRRNSANRIDCSSSYLFPTSPRQTLHQSRSSPFAAHSVLQVRCWSQQMDPATLA
jgi:hypothetical protein